MSIYVPVSERELNRQLHLPGIANALPQEAVKIEQPRRAQRVDVVCIVEGIEHLEDRDQCVPFTKLEGTLDAPVERKEFIVLSQGVAVGCCPHRRRDGLSAA